MNKNNKFLHPWPPYHFSIPSVQGPSRNSRHILEASRVQTKKMLSRPALRKRRQNRGHPLFKNFLDGKFQKHLALKIPNLPPSFEWPGLLLKYFFFAEKTEKHVDIFDIPHLFLWRFFPAGYFKKIFDLLCQHLRIDTSLSV